MSGNLPRWDRPEDAGFSSKRLQRLRGAMQGLVDDGSLPGVSVLVARHGRIVDVVSCGVRGSATDEPMSEDTICRWYSMTKSVTGMAMMLLFEEGAWRFEDPVSLFLPEIADMRVAAGGGSDAAQGLVPLSRPILMQDLLGHRAGFAYGINEGGPHPVDLLYAEQGVLSFDHEVGRLVREASRLPLVAQPGTRFHYSIAQDLCGAIVERLTGTSLGEFMRRRLFEPLGMTDTGFAVEPQSAHRLSALWQHDGTGRAVPASASIFNWSVTESPRLESGGAGLVGTLLDAWRFAEFIAGRPRSGGEALMAPGTLRMATRALHHDVATGIGSETGVGYTAGGLYVMDDPARFGSPLGRGTLNSGGAGGCWMTVDPEHDVVVVGLMSVLGWMHGTPPGYRAEVLVYQALLHP